MKRQSGGKDLSTPLRIGVLGALGQLGRCLVREIEAAPDLELAFAATREEVDLAEPERVPASLARLLGETGADPEVVVNAAAFTKVDACESESALAYRVNALAPAECARALSERGVRLVHVSTDYVFPGDGTRPYGEDDPSDPRTVYGSSKRAGEVAVLGTDPTALVVRTSWVFGPGRNFVAAVLDQAEKRRRGEVEGPLRVVDDQRGAPTAAADLARALLDVCRRVRSDESRVSGLLHLRNAGEATWWELAREALDRAGYSDVTIDAVPTSAFPTAATRPAYSVLDCARARSLGIEMRPWREALAEHLRSDDSPGSASREARQGAVAALSSTESSERPDGSAQENPG
ncbi:MAG: dTDP-4-dehydrorhamnose reductase [bacterium]